MSRVRFAPSPTGTLHVGNALGAVANRNFGGEMLLRIDDTDPARNVPGGEEAILEDLRWLGIEWDEGPVRQSERQERYREAAAELPQRFHGATLLRDDGTATYQLASVVDDVDFAITHVIRGNDHRPNEPLHRALHEALATQPPEYIHHGLVLGPNGRKLSKRSDGATVASLRDEGLPAEAVRAYLEELGLPRHDVHLDLGRIRSLAVDVLGSLSDDELARRAGIPLEAVPLARGAHDLREARRLADAVLTPPSDTVSLGEGERETLVRFRELRLGAGATVAKDDAKAIVREVKAVGGSLRTIRRALTGRDSGPELWAIVAAVSRDEALRRIDAAL
jgi:glutamyl-tRNA synthetase